MKRNALALSILAVAAAALSIHAPAALAEKSCAALDSVDPDGDGILDVIETKRAAKALFIRLDADKSGTLDVHELDGRLSPAALRAANPDGDGTLDRFEWKRLVKYRFRRANTDGDRTIECDELATPAGRALLAVLR